MQMNTDLIYPIGSIYKTTSSVFPSDKIGGEWQLIKEETIETGWKDFSWRSSNISYTDNPGYTLNKWRIKNNILYVVIGAHWSAKHTGAEEVNFARLPIQLLGDTKMMWTGSKRQWIGAVGTNGSSGGLALDMDQTAENTDMINIKVKTNSTFEPTWLSAYFVTPIDDYIITTVYPDIKKEYTWERVA